MADGLWSPGLAEALVLDVTDSWAVAEAMGAAAPFDITALKVDRGWTAE